MTLEELKHGVRALTIEERKQLITFIVDSLTEREVNKGEPSKRSILEFEGVGAELWQGVDAQDYVDQLRNEWDERP